MVLVNTPKAVKTNVCKRTLRLRNDSIKKQLELTSGGDTVLQTSSVLASFNPKDQQEILKGANVPTTSIDAETVVALKADLEIPWNKLRKLARYHYNNKYLIIAFLNTNNVINYNCFHVQILKTYYQKKYIKT